MKAVKTIALVAHDSMKQDMVDWVRQHADELCLHNLVCTGTTGRLVKEMLEKEFPEKKVSMKLLKSGPLGGDLQIGSMIAGREIDFLVFLTDPMAAQPHDVDVKALIRVAAVYNILMACNLTSADFAIKSPLFNEPYVPKIKDYSQYITRKC